jgi:hypothetical protein
MRLAVEVWKGIRVEGTGVELIPCEVHAERRKRKYGSKMLKANR